MQHGKARAISCSPGHHFFGFHDLPQWNHAGDMMLALRVEEINHPPLPAQEADSGIIPYPEGGFIPIHKTSAFNYPQGARQQWIGESDLYTCNVRGDDTWDACVIDARSRKLVDRLGFPVHCMDWSGKHAFFIDYSRLYRLGGYGYVGLPDRTTEDVPADCGIYKGSLEDSRSEILVSIRECAKTEGRRVAGRHHCLTHLALNPSGNRLAFLHRYFLPDGGLTTRLMTVDVDGANLRVLGKGFLSHFDWMDDEKILIWARLDNATRRLRELPVFWLPGGDVLAGTAKKIIKRLLGSGMKTNRNAAFLAIDDKENPRPEVVGAHCLVEDGHPMFCPADRNLMVVDTYPEEEGWRRLMLYRVKEDSVDDLGRYRMIFDEPDWNRWNRINALPGVEPFVVRAFGERKLIYTRSGLHCDLHPRWHPKGKAVAFDSIHDGTRQIYVIEFTN